MAHRVRARSDRRGGSPDRAPDAWSPAGERPALETEGGVTNAQTDSRRKALTHALVIWAIVAPVWILIASALRGRFALDFRHAFLPAAHAVIHGASPYSALGSRALAEGTAYLYPPVSAYLLAPFTLLPPVAAEILAVSLLAACVPVALLVLGVRDRRCLAIAFLWWPTIIAIQSGNLTLLMVLGLALVWRFRDRTWAVALAAGLLVALKLFFWPVLVWLVATRRLRTAALAAAAAALLVLVPWAGIGFAGLRDYPHLLSSVANSEGPRSYSVAALFHSVLPSWTAATAVESLVGASLLALVVAAGRRGRDRDAFALSIVAILVLSPLLEMHYLAVMLVVVALYRRTLGLAWAVPLFFWGAPATTAGSPAQVVHVLAVVVATFAIAYRDWQPQPPRLLIKGWEDLSRSGGV